MEDLNAEFTPLSSDDDGEALYLDDRSGVGAIERSTGATVCVRTLTFITVGHAAAFVKAVRELPLDIPTGVVRIRRVEELSPLRTLVVEEIPELTSVDAAIDRGWKPSDGHALQILRSATQIVAALHESGVAHGAVGPAYVFVDEDGDTALAPLSLGRFAPASDSAQDFVHVDPSATADLLGLGALAWDLFSHAGEDDGNQQRRLSDARPDLPPRLLFCVDLLLNENPDERFESARDALAAIEKVVESVGQALSSTATKSPQSARVTTSRDEVAIPSPRPTPASGSCTAQHRSGERHTPRESPSGPQQTSQSHQQIASNETEVGQTTPSRSSTAPTVLVGGLLAVVALLVSGFFWFNTASRKVDRAVSSGDVLTATALMRADEGPSRIASDVRTRYVLAADAWTASVLQRFATESRGPDAGWAVGAQVASTVESIAPAEAGHSESASYFAGQVAFEEKRWPDAKLAFSRATQATNGLVRSLAWNGVGKSCWKRPRDSECTIAAYLRTIELSPTWVFPRMNLASALLELRRFDEAEKYYLSVVQIDSRRAFAYYGLGLTYLGQRRYPEARQSLEYSLSISGLSEDERATARQTLSALASRGR